MVEGDRGTSAAMRDVMPAFVRDLSFGALPADVVAQGQRCLLDLIGVAAAGSRTHSARIANAYAATQLCGRERDARILFDGRRASLAGAAFAGAATIDALDAHDGHVLTKGHAGVAVLPTLLAVIDGAHRGEPRGRRRARVPRPARARLRNRDARRHRAARERHRLSLLGRVECARLRRRRRAPLVASTTRGSATRWASPNTAARADRSCAFAIRPTMVKDGSAGARMRASPRRCSRATASPARRRSPSSATTRAHLARSRQRAGASASSTSRRIRSVAGRSRRSRRR